MTDQIYAVNVGLVINIDFDEVITGATDLKFNYKLPDETTGYWVPTITGARRMSYTVKTGDLVVGTIEIQPSFTLGAWSGLSTPVQIRVYDRFE
jgi:hypothetical protein